MLRAQIFSRYELTLQRTCFQRQFSSSPLSKFSLHHRTKSIDSSPSFHPKQIQSKFRKVIRMMSAKDRGRYHATESLHYAQKQISFVSDEKEDLQQKRAFDELEVLPLFAEKTGKQNFDRISYIGKPKALQKRLERDLERMSEQTREIVNAFVANAKKDKAQSTVIATGVRVCEKTKKTIVREIAIGVLPQQVSRHNDKSGSHGLQDIAKACCGDGKTRRLVLVSEEEEEYLSLVCALTRAFPVFSMKSKASAKDDKEAKESPAEPMVVSLSGASASTIKKAIAISEAVELACRMVDTPPTSMDPQGMIDEAMASAKRVEGVKTQVWRDKELRSNVFDIWLGLGLPWLIILPSQPNGRILIKTAQLLPSVGILFGVLMIYYFSLYWNSWRLTRRTGAAFLLVYVLFAGYCVLFVWLQDIYDLS